MDRRIEPPRPAAYLARWFVLLGILALVPVAATAGSDIGDLLRHPDRGLSDLVGGEAPLTVLAVAAIFAFATGQGLSLGRRWAVLLGLVEAGVVSLGGLVLLTANAALMRSIGAPEVLALAVIPAGIGAMLLGARLFGALWTAIGLSMPLGRSDARALGALAAVVAVALVGHLVVAGIAS